MAVLPEPGITRRKLEPPWSQRVCLGAVDAPTGDDPKLAVGGKTLASPFLLA